MESIRESSRNATCCCAKTFKCSQTQSSPHPTLGSADGQVGFWEFCSVTGSLFLPHACLRASVFDASAALRYEARGTGCTCPSCPFMCTTVTGQQAVFLLTAWSQTCRHACCKARTCTQVRALTVCVFPVHYDILKTLRMFSGHLTSCASYTHHQGPGVAVTLLTHIYSTLFRFDCRKTALSGVVTVCSCSFETAWWRWRCQRYIRLTF